MFSRSRTEASATTALAAVLVGVGLIALTGCAGIQHALQEEHEASSATYAEEG
jgi:hypothetical protein